MSQRSRLSSQALLALMIAAAVASCQAYPSAPVAPAGQAVSQATGTVTANLAPLFERLRSRRVQGMGFDEAAIQNVRLSAAGPGLAEVHSAVVPFSGTMPVISLTVTAGINRVFLLEALDAEGHALAEIITLADVQSGSALSLTFNGDTDAAGYVLHEVLKAPTTTYPNAAAFRTQSVVGPLVAFINQATGLTAANQFSGVNPLAYDRAFLIDRLRQIGPSYLQTTPLPEALKLEAWARVSLVPTQLDGRTPYTGDIDVDLFDPVSGTAYGWEANEAGEIVIPKAAPGHWWVRLKPLNSPAIWHKLEVAHDVQRKLAAFAPPPAPVALSSGGLTPVIAGNYEGSESLVVYRDAAGIKGQFLNADRTARGVAFELDGNAVGREPAVAYNPYREEYLVAWFEPSTRDVQLVWRVLTAQASLTDLVLQRVGSDGQLLGAPHRIIADRDGYGTNAPSVSVAASSADGDYMVAWTHGESIAVDKVSADLGQNGTYEPTDSLTGTTLYWDSAFACAGVAEADHASIAYNQRAGRYMVVWGETDPYEGGNTQDVQYLLIDGETDQLVPSAFGAVPGADGSGAQGSPIVASYSPGDKPTWIETESPAFLVAWEDRAAGGSRAVVTRCNAEAGYDFNPQRFSTPPLMVSQGGYAANLSLNFLPQVYNEPEYIESPYQEGQGNEIILPPPPPDEPPSADHFLLAWDDGANIRARRLTYDVELDGRGEMLISAGETQQRMFPAVHAQPGSNDYTLIWQHTAAGGLFRTVVR